MHDMTRHDTVEALAGCDNCGARLQGPYCHVCGQSAHNPLHHVRHALEEVFESFWHLDGRVFRTLRDLLVPGRVIRRFLDGHRICYIPPLRLYVILSVITFFVAHFAAAGMGTGLDINTSDPDIGKATTVAEVVRLRDARLAEMDKSAADVRRDGGNPLAESGIAVGRSAIVDTANRRIAQLGGKPLPPSSAPLEPEADFGPPVPSTDHTWWGGIKRRWQDNAAANLRTFARDKSRFGEAMLTHVPTTLFVLVPVFALLLRLTYLLKRMGYLEHLVVALYSHAMLLLLALEVMLCLLAAKAWHWPSGVMTTVVWLSALGAAGWLLATQKRVYGQGWPATIAAWCVVGLLYTVLVSLALAAAVTMTFVAGAH